MINCALFLKQAGIKKVPDSTERLQGYKIPFVGFRFFLSKPKLWLTPLLGTLFAWVLLFSVFLVIIYSMWPQADASMTEIMKSIAVGSFSCMALWVFIVPVFLNLSFEHLIKQVYLDQGDSIHPLSFVKTCLSGCYVLVKTLHWRLVWIVLAGMIIFVCAPLIFFVVQLAVAHSAVLDGCDLSLNIKGVNAETRLRLIQQHKRGILAGGVLGGIVSSVFMPTVLVWLFWIPGLYVGACLWVREWV